MDEPPATSRPAWRWLIDAAGLALLGAAVTLALRGADWQAVRGASWRMWAGATGLVAALYAVNVALFWLATKPVERGRAVRVWDWVMMLPASGLLNYLPARIGLLARVAYMKKVYGIGYRASALVMLALAAASAGVYLLAGGLTWWLGEFSAAWWAMMVAGLIGGAAVGWPLARWGIRLEGGRLPRGLPAWIVLVYALRLADLAIVAWRLQLAGRITGIELDFGLAVMLAVACNLAMLLSPVPGGVGLREGIGGLVMQWQGAGEGAVTLAAAMGLLLVDRATEVVVTGTTGLIGLGWMRWRLARSGQDSTVSIR